MEKYSKVRIEELSGVKLCRKCNCTKSIIDFRKLENKSENNAQYSSYCKECLQIVSSEHYFKDRVRKQNYTRLDNLSEQEKKDRQKLQQRIWREKNKDKLSKEYKEKYLEKRGLIREKYLSNTAAYMLRRAKSRAKKSNLSFDLTIEDIIIPEFCPILKLKLEVSLSGAPSNNSPSLDRIVPELGYTKGNVMVISNLANVMKNNARAEELVLFAKWVLSDEFTKIRKSTNYLEFISNSSLIK